MQYLDDLITRLAEKCTAISPSGYGGPYTVDNDVITVDSDLISIDEE